MTDGKISVIGGMVGAPNLSEDQQAMIYRLSEALRMARAGELQAAVLISVTANDDDISVAYQGSSIEAVGLMEHSKLIIIAGGEY